MFQIPSVEEMGGEDSPITPMFAKRQKIASPTKSTPDENSGPTTENDNTANQRTASSSAMTGSTLSSAALNSIKNTTEKLNQSSKPRADSNQVCQITSTASTSSTIHVDYKQIINAAPSASSKLRHLASSVPQPTENKPSKDLFDIKDKVDEKEQNGGVVPQRNYSGATIFALHRQKGNPILKFIRNVPVEFVNDIAPDYILSEATCALFLSIRYHHLNPGYIYDRIRKVGSAFKLRLLLLQVDVIDPSQSLCELNKACFHADFTLLLAFSAQEAGRYLETYKVYQFKPVDLLRANTETDPTSRAIEFLTAIKTVTKRDAETLLLQFDTIANICKATEAQLKVCPGLGATKAKKLHEALHQPFFRQKKTTPSLTSQQSVAESNPKPNNRNLINEIEEVEKKAEHD